ncbi:hypothetical protein [Pseudomonas sp. PB3P13]
MHLFEREPEKGFEGACRFGYKTGYIADNLESIDLPFSKAVSASIPLDWDNASLEKAPKLLMSQGRDGLLYPDAVLDDDQVVQHWCVKFARNRAAKWRAVCEALSVIGDPEALFEGLRDDANRFLALPDILSASGLPEVTLNHPAIALRNLEQRLQRWGLK